MSSKQIISGEASESDDEQHEHSRNQNVNKLFHDNFQKNRKNLKHGIEIAEDALVQTSIASCTEDANKKFHMIDSKYKSESDSMLRKNLIETTTSFWFSINHTIQNKILTLSRQLFTADQLLLKSQVILQSISLNLKNVNTTSMQILNKTNDIVIDSNFIPDIKLRNENKK